MQDMWMIDATRHIPTQATDDQGVAVDFTLPSSGDRRLKESGLQCDPFVESGAPLPFASMQTPGRGQNPHREKGNHMISYRI